MNPLKHFGVNTEFIRGDTTSYNARVTCKRCGGNLSIEERSPDNEVYILKCNKCGSHDKISVEQMIK